MAQRLGITHFDFKPGHKIPQLDEHIGIGQYDVSPLDMAAAYGVFDNHGVKVPVTPVVKVTKPDGSVLEDHTNPEGEQVLNPDIAETVTDMLRGPIEHGTASGPLANFGRPAAGKTGTTNDESDAWFVGYTPQLSTAVWMGHDGGIQPLRGVGRLRRDLRRHRPGYRLGRVHEAGHGQPAAARLPQARAAPAAERGGRRLCRARPERPPSQHADHPPAVHRL